MSMNEMQGIYEAYLDSLKSSLYDELSVKEEAKLSERILSNPDDNDAVDALVRSRIRFAFKRAIKIFPFAKFKIPPEDLISCANMAIVKAAKRFDYRKNTKFTTYIEFWLRNECYNYLHGSHIVKVPVRIASNTDLFSKLNLRAVSIDQPLTLENSGQTDEIQYNILDANGISEEPDTSIEEELIITSLLDVLSDKEKYVIIRRFLHEKTLRDIAEELGGTITHQGVNVIEKRAIEKMKKKYKGDK